MGRRDMALKTLLQAQQKGKTLPPTLRIKVYNRLNRMEIRTQHFAQIPVPLRMKLLKLIHKNIKDALDKFNKELEKQKLPTVDLESDWKFKEVIR